MFKRLFWFTLGLGVGVVGSAWFRRRTRQAVERFLPERVANDVISKMRSLGEDLRAAAREGRATMHEREASLWAEVDSSTPNGPVTGRSPSTHH